MYISILCVRLWKIYRNVTKRGEEYSYRWLLRGTIFYLRYGFNIIKNILKYYETGRRIFLRIVAPRDTPRHPNKIEMERHEACFKSNSDQEFKYFCLMPCNALFGDKCYPFFRGVLEIQSSPEHQPYFMCCRKWRVDCWSSWCDPQNHAAINALLAPSGQCVNTFSFDLCIYWALVRCLKAIP